MRIDRNQHPNYKYMEMNEFQLRNELKKLCREDLINWLSWNDKNGIYKEEESLSELGNIMSYEEGVEIMIRQIIQN